LAKMIDTHICAAYFLKQNKSRLVFVCSVLEIYFKTIRK
jgi:hypothetical protein